MEAERLGGKEQAHLWKGEGQSNTNSVHVQVHACVCMHACVCTGTFLCVCMYLHVCACLCTHTCACVGIKDT